MTPVYPERLSIAPLARPPAATVRVPGSKSITNRALVLAALISATRPVTLTGALDSEDTYVMIDGLRRLGFDIAACEHGETITVRSTNPARRIPASSADLFVANSGTTMRFLTAMAALGQGRYRLDGVPRMRQRPIQDLLDALKPLGVEARSETGDGCPPVVVEACGLHGGRAVVRGDVSSQFLSGLLMAAPFADDDVVVEIEGPLVSVPYVDMTLAMLRQFGLQVEHDDYRRFRICACARPEVLEEAFAPIITQYAIEPDASAASYFFGAAALTGGTVTVAGLPSPSLQGDVRFVELLAGMGCDVRREADRITVQGGPLRGIDVDMNDISDTVMTLGAVACFAKGPTRIRNVAHIRHKETDRLTALASELRRVGAGVEVHDDGLTVEPGPLHGAEIETYNDHRMAMSLALVGLRVPGMVIKNPGCVAKTYPRFFHDFAALATR
jgi:3-phosphoshikimate 1-carboxyvinyltransferase